MNWIEKNNRALRDFGLVIGISLVLFTALIPLIRGAKPSLAGLCLGAFIGLLGLWFPKSLRVPYALWMRIGTILGYVNTRVLLALLFFGVVAPLALVKKAVESRRPKRRAPAESFRISAKVRMPHDMEYPF